MDTSQIEAAAIQYWANIAYEDVHLIANPHGYTTGDIDGLSWYELPEAIKQHIRGTVKAAATGNE